MISVQSFSFNPYPENTYVLFDETGECLLIDPGCYTREEQDTLVKFIRDNRLKPAMLLNTHCHIDHVLGNKFISDLFGLSPVFHRLEKEVLELMVAYAASTGLSYDPSPPAGRFLEEGEKVSFGSQELEVLFTPGHSPGSLSFFSPESRLVIAGDVLFRGSVGRTDLPGGDYDTLINSIESQLFPLGDDVKVYAGHGPATTIGYERENNPFF